MSERLDRLESIVLELATSQIQTQRSIEALGEQIGQLAEADRQQREELRDNIRDVVSMIGSVGGLVESVSSDLDALSANVNAYISQSTAFLAAEQRDRSEFRQQMIGLQTESRNILQELAELRRQGN